MAQGQEVCLYVTGWGFDPHSRKWNNFLKLNFQFFALVPEFGGKWGTERLNIRFIPSAYPAVCGIQLEFDFVNLVTFYYLHAYVVYSWILKDFSVYFKVYPP